MGISSASPSLERNGSSLYFLRSSPLPGVIGLLCLHAAFVPVFHASKLLVTLHALLTISIALYWALSSSQIEKVAYAGAYIAGSEVLWRMNSAHLPWEIAELAIILLFGIVLCRLQGSFRNPGTGLPLFYFALLLPAIPFTLFALSFSEARSELSMNLSGPLALAVSALFFQQLRLSREQLGMLFWALIIPITGIALTTLHGTLTASSINWVNDSNFQTSGGFGPNQVSSSLGLGVLAAFLYLMIASRNRVDALIALFLLVLCAVQCAMTFSRGGLYNAGGGMIAALMFLLKDRQTRLRFLSLGAILIPLIGFVLLPRLDAFTGGALLTRFKDTQMTHRGEIAADDLRIFQKNWLFGVGPGRAKAMRTSLNEPVAAHTEFTRLLAEHGIFGALALVVLAWMGVYSLIRSRDDRHRAFVAAMLLWSLLYMSNAAMRTAAAPFLFGMTAVSFVPEISLLPLYYARRLQNAPVRSWSVKPSLR